MIKPVILYNENAQNSLAKSLDRYFPDDFNMVGNAVRRLGVCL